MFSRTLVPKITFYSTPRPNKKNVPPLFPLSPHSYHPLYCVYIAQTIFHTMRVYIVHIFFIINVWNPGWNKVYAVQTVDLTLKNTFRKSNKWFRKNLIRNINSDLWLVTKWMHITIVLKESTTYLLMVCRINKYFLV